MRRCQSTVILILLLLLSVPVLAQQKPAAPQWSRVRTDNFTVIGNIDPARARDLALRLEQFRAGVRNTLGLKGDRPNPTRAIVFRDAAEFRTYKPKRADGTPDDLVSAIFHADGDLNLISTSDDAKEIGSLFHEYVHDLLARSFSKAAVPAWLNEGLAEYLQQFRIVDAGRIEFGLPEWPHLARLRRGELMNRDEFLSIDDTTLQQSGDAKRLRFYAQAWALVSFLIQRQTSSTGAAQATPIDLARLVRDANQLSVEELNSGIREFAVAESIRSRPLIVSSEARSMAPESSTASESEVNAYLGDLAYRMRDLALAETHLVKAVAISPDSSLANASLGLLRTGQRRFADAKVLLDRAIKGDSSNFRAYYYSAFLISREHTDEFGTISRVPAAAAVRMRTLLRRAIELNPEHADSYKLFSIVSLITGDEMEAALSSINKAIAIQPANQEHRLIGAKLLLRLGRLEEGAAAAAQLLAETNDKYLRSEAEEVLRAAKAFTEARKEVNELSVNLKRSDSEEPLILHRKDLTDEDIARIERERQNNNLNRLIDRPGANEIQAVGRIESISCDPTGIAYKFRADAGTLDLRGRNFDDLKVKVLLTGTHSFTFKCGASFERLKAVIVFRPSERRNAAEGALRSLAFVPENFRLRSIDELTRERQIIIEGLRPTDLTANAETAAAEQKELDRQMRETQLRNIAMRLRETQSGEKRLIAIPDKLECVQDRFVLTAASGNLHHVFSTPISNKFEIRSFTPETGILFSGCNSKLPAVPAVITYRTEPSTPGRNELIAIEFVPGAFKLQ